MKHPDFDELVGAEVEGPERERLHDIHDLLLAAGPPPELPPALALPPGPERDDAVRVLRSTYPRRRHVAAVALAAALALAAFGGGYLLGDRGEEAAGGAARLVKMVGTEASPGAVASLRLFVADEDGNRTIELTVRGLQHLPGRGYYELGLTRDGELVAPCGTFNVAGGKTLVTFDVPYEWSRFDGWAIVAHEEPDLGEAGDFLLTTEG
jgi:hypothetical protein